MTDNVKKIHSKASSPLLVGHLVYVENRRIKFNSFTSIPDSSFVILKTSPARVHPSERTYISEPPSTVRNKAMVHLNRSCVRRELKRSRERKDDRKGPHSQ